jgi:dienelactone hydrolase
MARSGWWALAVTAMVVSGCKGGGSGTDDGTLGDDDDDDDAVHSTVPWSQVETTMPECCSLVKTIFQWEEGALTHSRAEWAVPEDPIGAVIILHGSSGNIAAVQQAEWLQLYNVLYPRGIAILMTQSIDRDSGQWSLEADPNNEDIDHIEEMIAAAAEATDLEVDDPIVTVGFSNGAAFSRVLADALLTRGRNVKGAVMHNGGPGAVAQGIPGLWVTAENDDTGGGADALGAWADEQADGTHFAGYEVPMERYRFAKVPAFTQNESSMLFDYIVDDLGWFDADGVRQIEFEGDPDKFADQLTGDLQVNYAVDAMQQLRVVWALHRMSSQFKLEEAAWIEERMLR